MINRRLAACCCALLLLLGNAAVVQVVAWSAMIVQRSITAGVADAVSSTFSGERPCMMCRTARAIDRGTDPAALPGVVKLLKKAEAALPALPELSVACGPEVAVLAGWPVVAVPRGLRPAPEPPPPRC